MSNEAADVKVEGLDKLIKALGMKKPPQARVGILGTHNARSSKDSKANSNATIGAAHEFGTTKIPMRSFLRIPISENLNKRLESSGALDKDVLDQVIKAGTIIPWLTNVAILAQSIVLEAFDTNGFGKWKPLNPKTLERKKVKQTLVETQQLRNSITYEVKE